MVTVNTLLQQSGVERVDARVLLQHVLKVSHAWLIAHGDEEVPAGIAAAFLALASRRRQGEPVAYLTGEREFYGLVFCVNPHVLIPRPETELLVELALARIPTGAALRILDLGTGSGAIAIAIAKHRPCAQVYATDQSASALQLAQQNAAAHRVTVHLSLGSWFAAVPGQQFDLIVSNPPYITGNDPHLIEGDLRFEPLHALTDNSTDGLSAIRTIIQQAPQYLSAGGQLWFEHGYDQARACRLLLQKHGFSHVQSHCDLAGIERVSGGTDPAYRHDAWLLPVEKVSP